MKINNLYYVVSSEGHLFNYRSIEKMSIRRRAVSIPLLNIFMVNVLFRSLEFILLIYKK